MANYTEEDRARVYVILVTNEGNVKRTARETGMAEQTVRRWKREFEENGPPMVDDLEVAAGDFLETAERVRWKAIQVMEYKIKDARPSELTAIIGMLTDKIDRARGLAIGRVEHVHSLPTPEEMGEILKGAFAGVLEMARERQGEIVDAEVVEIKALPAPSSRP